MTLAGAPIDVGSIPALCAKLHVPFLGFPSPIFVIAIRGPKKWEEEGLRGIWLGAW